MDLCNSLPVSMTDLMPRAANRSDTERRETFRLAAAPSVVNILNYFRGEPATSPTRTRLRSRAQDRNRVANRLPAFRYAGWMRRR